MPYLWRASFVGTPINITIGPFVQLIPSIYIQNVHLFGAFDPEKNSFQIAQRHYKIFQKLPVNFAETFQPTFVLQQRVYLFNTGRQQTKLLFKSCATLNSVTQFLDGRTSSLHKLITSTKFQRLVTSSGSGRNWKQVPKKYNLPMSEWTDRDQKERKKILNG